MAMVFDEATVEKHATAAAWRAGEKLHQGGAVTGTRSEGGGAAGMVADRGQEYELWTGFVNRRLVGQCPCAGRAKFCAHAVALALDAVRLALPWAKLEQRQRRTDPAEAYKALSAGERGEVLDALLAEQPNLRKDAYRLALTLLAPASGATSADAELEELRADTAEAIAQALQDLDVSDMKSGHQPGHGYIDEFEAARELIEPAVAVFEQDALRRLKLGLTDAAVAVAQGVLDGLRACEGSHDGDEVLCYAGEELAHDYGFTLIDEFEKAGIRLEWREAS
jgi:hypothetical protein